MEIREVLAAYANVTDLWKEVETFFQGLCCSADTGYAVPNSEDVLTFAKVNGTFRVLIVNGERAVPITDCPLKDRIEMSAHIHGLHDMILASREETAKEAKHASILLHNFLAGVRK